MASRAKKDGYARCRYCNGADLVPGEFDGERTTCRDCRKARREMTGYANKVGAAAKRFYRLVKKGVV